MKEAYGTYEDKCHPFLLSCDFCLGPVYDFPPVICMFGEALTLSLQKGFWRFKSNSVNGQLVFFTSPAVKAIVGAGSKGDEEEKAEKAVDAVEKTKRKRCHGGTGESLEQSRTAKQVCHYPQIFRWTPAGFSQKRLTPRYILSCLALAWSAESSWAKTIGYLWISFWI